MLIHRIKYFFAIKKEQAINFNWKVIKKSLISHFVRQTSFILLLNYLRNYLITT